MLETERRNLEGAQEGLLANIPRVKRIGLK